MKKSKLFLMALCATMLAAGPLGADQKKYDTSLKFLRNMNNRPMLRASLKGKDLAAATKNQAVVTVKFDHVLTDAEIDSYRQLGVAFYYIDGNVARTGSIYPARIDWESLDLVAGHREVLRMESRWKPAILPLLDVSAHEIEADSAWGYTDALGYPLTGKGTRIADFDTGIDVFHPSFFLADGDTFDWIDVDGFGSFDPGSDVVDLNDNGSADLGEILQYNDGWIYDPAHVWGGSDTNNMGNGYQTYWDWLYNDANTNGRRDYGPDDGYSESDPTYGELLFVVLDDNDNGDLDVGEKLVALHTSKIYATMTADSVERLRGVDLILSEVDDYGHGTPVSGILAGGTPGRHIFTGIAPEAEILMGYFFSDIPISYLIPWARSRDADVMLFEFGGFIWDYLDGSSLEEELITIESETIIQITPSGNLGRGAKHAIATVSPGDSVILEINVPPYGGGSIFYWYGTTLWTTEENDLTFRLKTPVGGQIEINGGSEDVDGYYIWSDRSTSTRGTCRFDLYVDCDVNINCHGLWELTLVNTTGSAIETIDNVTDHRSSWAGGAEFLNYVSDDRNVTWPSTADGGFVNGSYSTRGFEGYGGVGGGSIPAGEISAFSGRGPRIDGVHLLDICSPGNYDVYSPRSHQDGAGYPNGSYRQFSGTSAAGPHVAAAAALVIQAFPNITMQHVACRLTAHAATDGFTGSVYNDTWGWGKLRILGALGIPTDVEDIDIGAEPPRLLLDQNYPNPFNPSTWIPFYIPADGRASLRIYNVRGELVKVLKDKRMTKGAHSATWDGRDVKGRTVASGLYFCVLRFAGEAQTRKLVLLR